MPAVDLIILTFALVMALWGYGQGLIASAFALLGFAAGGLIGSRVGPLVLEEGARSPQAPLFALVGALVLGGLLAAVLELLGYGVRGRLGPAIGPFDGLGGAALLTCVSLGLAWIAGAFAVQTEAARDYRREIQRSRILRTLNEELPPSGPLLGALARFDPFPSIRAPSPNVASPTGRIARDADVRQARRGVVRVLGSACGFGVQGSGWVAGGGLIVTNAHVIAGQDDTTVQVEGRGPAFAAQAVWIDPHNDLAMLRAPATAQARPLRLRVNARPGSAAAVLGFPGNGDYDIRPARVGPTISVLAQDAYGNGPIRRRVTGVRGLVRSGNSGGPVVDARGSVVTTIFAASLGRRRRSGFGVPASVVRRALRGVRGPVDTGPCTR